MKKITWSKRHPRLKNILNLSLFLAFPVGIVIIHFASCYNFNSSPPEKPTRVNPHVAEMEERIRLSEIDEIFPKNTINLWITNQSQTQLLYLQECYLKSRGWTVVEEDYNNKFPYVIMEKDNQKYLKKQAEKQKIQEEAETQDKKDLDEFYILGITCGTKVN